MRIDENLMHTEEKPKLLSLPAEFAAGAMQKCHTAGDATAGCATVVFPVLIALGRWHC